MLKRIGLTLTVAGFCFLTNLYTPLEAQALKQYEQDMINVYKKVSPSVVSIATETYEEDFFMDAVPRKGAGSGVVIDKLGRVLTNYHVIEGAEKINVFFGKQAYPAKVIGSAPNNDLAVLQVSAPESILVPVKLGDSSKLQVGQTAIAIGNPFGVLGRSMTTGIVSALNRDIQSEQGVYRGMIQTDASINSGNSGGPLVNTDGELIGINTLIFSKSGGSVGIGFSIPVNTAKKFIPSLITQGQVTYPWLGVSLLPISDGIASDLNLPVEKGLLVLATVPGSSAHKAGVRGGNRYINIRNVGKLPLGGDIILAMDGEEINSIEELSSYLETNKSVGDVVKLKVVRNGKSGYINVKLQARPANAR